MRIVFIVMVSLFANSGIDAQNVTTLRHDIIANGAISVCPDGTVLVSEYGTWSGNQGDGTRIFKLSPKGEILDTIQGLRSPMGTAMDSQGNLFVNNDNNMQRGQLLKITPKGERSIIANIDGWPSGMNIDKNDNLYLPNYSKGILHKISPTGKVTIVAQDSLLLGCTGVDFDSKGNIILSNFLNAKIFRVTPSGQVSLIAQIPNITIQQFGIGYLTVIEDLIYATAIAKNKIYTITLAGEISELIGTGARSSQDGTTAHATFNGPNGIRASNDGKTLYISEYGGSQKIRAVHLN